MSFGVGAGVRPPRVSGRIRQLLGAVAEYLSECGVDLYDGTVLVADEEPFLQRVHQSSAPASLMVAGARQLDIGAHPGQKLCGGEWLDEVVVGASLQAFDRGLLPGTRGQ